MNIDLDSIAQKIKVEKEFSPFIDEIDFSKGYFDVMQQFNKLKQKLRSKQFGLDLYANHDHDVYRIIKIENQTNYVLSTSLLYNIESKTIKGVFVSEYKSDTTNRTLNNELSKSFSLYNNNTVIIDLKSGSSKLNYLYHSGALTQIENHVILSDKENKKDIYKIQLLFNKILQVDNEELNDKVLNNFMFNHKIEISKDLIEFLNLQHDIKLDNKDFKILSVFDKKIKKPVILRKER